MIKCIAFPSYKGGTGKTTIAANLAVLLARKRYHVFLIELDVYAPSLNAYFGKEPIKWLNNLLWSKAEADDVMMDLTPTIVTNTSDNDNCSVKGKLYVGFCNPKKEEIYKLDGEKSKTLQGFNLCCSITTICVVTNKVAEYCTPPSGATTISVDATSSSH
jgi:chromosome partitioning protein